MRVLVVEDEQKLANAIKRALELQKYVVDQAFDGTTGLDLAQSEDYGLIILDIMLPSLDGISLCRQLRQEKIHTPILMLTARTQVSDRISGLDSGADDYMAKPFSFEELFARIRALTRRPLQISSNVLSVGDLYLNPLSFQVTLSGREIKLSSKEFSILEYLLNHKNTVISRDQLISHLWNYDSDVMPNVVEVHIKHLRDKIDHHHPELIIQTIRGKGYLIKDSI